MTGPRIPDKGAMTPYQDFLYRQWARIKARGGTDQDWAKYLQHAEGLPLRNIMNAPREDTGAPTPGLALGLSMSALQGITFGFGDEALGGLVGLATLATGGGIEQAANRQRQTTEGFREQRANIPRKVGIPGEILGAIANPANALLAPIKGAGLLRTAGRVARVGAGAGAVTGAGEADGPISDRAKGALVGGTAGAILAPIVVGGAHLGGAGLKGSVNLLTRWGTALGERRGVGAPRARELLAQAIARDGLTVEQVVQRATQAQTQGAPVTIADLAGDETMALALAAQGIRGEAKRQLADELVGRQADQGARMLGQLFRATRLGTKNAYDAGEEILAHRQAEAAPLYAEAFHGTVNVTPKMRQLLQTPQMQDAYLLGRSIANAEDLAGIGQGLPVPELFQTSVRGALRPGERAQRIAGTRGFEVTGARATPPDPSLPGTPRARSFQVGGEIEQLAIPETLPIRALDYMKRGLDAVIERAGREERPTLDRQLGRSLRQVLNDALAEVDAQSPVYARARATYRGHTEALEALQLGQEGFLRKPPELIARELAALTPSQRELYRAGATQALADAIHGQTTEAPNIARRFFGGRAHGNVERSMEQRIQTLFSDKGAAQDFMDYVRTEAKITEGSGRLLSRTPTPGVSASELAGGKTVVRRQVGTTLIGLAQNLAARARAGWSEEVSDEVSNLFTKGLRDPQELQALLTSLRAYEHGLQRQGLRRAVTSAAAGAQGARLVP